MWYIYCFSGYVSFQISERRTLTCKGEHNAEQIISNRTGKDTVGILSPWYQNYEKKSALDLRHFSENPGSPVCPSWGWGWVLTSFCEAFQSALCCFCNQGPLDLPVHPTGSQQRELWSQNFFTLLRSFDFVKIIFPGFIWTSDAIRI